MIEEGGNRKESGSERSMEHNSGDKSYFFTFSKQIMYISIMMMRALFLLFSESYDFIELWKNPPISRKSEDILRNKFM